MVVVADGRLSTLSSPSIFQKADHQRRRIGRPLRGRINVVRCLVCQQTSSDRAQKMGLAEQMKQHFGGGAEMA